MTSAPPAVPAVPPGRAVELAHEAALRLLRTVDAMQDGDWTAPSVLPGWTRAHVVAHLTLNAEGLAAVAVGLQRRRPVPIYRSDAARDADIAALARRSPAVQRQRLFAATTAWREEVAALAPRLYAGTVQRTPGGAVFAAAEIPCMRWREVEIHHADLALGYGPEAWPAEFVDYLLPVVAWDRGAELDLVLRTPDGDVPVGDGTGPVIAGAPAALAWWLLGRGAGEGLTGELPRLGPWVRRPPHPS